MLSCLELTWTSPLAFLRREERGLRWCATDFPPSLVAALSSHSTAMTVPFALVSSAASPLHTFASWYPQLS